MGFRAGLALGDLQPKVSVHRKRVIGNGLRRMVNELHLDPNLDTGLECVRIHQLQCVFISLSFLIIFSDFLMSFAEFHKVFFLR